MASTMVADPGARPSVLPTDRLQPNGMLRPELRADVRRIDGRRNALTIALLWAWVAAMFAAVALTLNPLLVVAVFICMGPVHARFAILMHESAHKLLFANRRVNDWVGTWLIAYPAFIPIGLYRRGHFAHHREEFGPGDPDVAFYSGYPGPASNLRRRLVRDAVGISGWKNLWPLLKATRTPGFRRVAWSIIGVQIALWAVMALATGLWWIYPVLWLLPWLTVWRVLNRLRSIAEHGGLEASDDRRVTTHNVRQSMWARFWIVPYNTGWHLAHHVDMGIPWRNLPRFHDELVRAGYVTPAITYSGYLALWRAQTAG